MAFEHSVGSGKATVNIKYCDKVLIDWREKNLVSAEEIRAFLDKKKEDYKKLAKGTKPEENSSFSTDDFFDAAIKRSYKKKNG